MLIAVLCVFAFVRPGSAGEAQSLAAVVPAGGEITSEELRSVVIEVRGQLRYNGKAVAVQKTVRDALARCGVKGTPTQGQLRQMADVLGVGTVIIPLVEGSGVGGYELVLIRYGVEGGGTVQAVRANLPSRGAAVYTRKQIKPAAAATVAFLLNAHPNPLEGPFPSIRKAAVSRLLSEAAQGPGRPRKETEIRGERETEAPESDAHPNPEVHPDGDDEKSERDWERWDHKGLFGEVGFMFSWCRQDGLCAETVKGYGAHFRAGIRIMSYVALSVSGIAVDHQMPITTNTEVFLNVDSAFVFAGFFGGLRVHPVRRFPVDPFVGVDFGNLWLLYSENTTVDIDPNIPANVADQLQNSMGNRRREVIYLRGFTVTPEVGVNFFIAPSFAMGFHAQWLLPFWKKACVQVYNPTLEGLRNTAQTCSDMKKIKENETIDSTVTEKLSKKGNLPRFVSIELDLTLLFK